MIERLENTMTHASMMDFRLREEMAGAVLKEVAALEPAVRQEEAPSLVQVVTQAVQSLEELWGTLRRSLESGVSPSDAVAVGRILSRSVNLVASSVELLAAVSPALAEFRQDSMLRLERIKAHASPLCRIVGKPAPVPDPDRLRVSLEQMERNEGVEVEDFLAELKG
jgi:hypothetical protein